MPLLKSVIYAALAVPNWIFRRSLEWPQRPVFYDIDAVCPPLRSLEDNYQSIREEFEALQQDLETIPAYHEVDRNQDRIARSPAGGKVWRVFFLETMGRKVELNRSLCPFTSAVIDRIPNVFQACFSILDGRKSIPSHCSPYNGYLRYHLGIATPRASPPSIRIKDESYTWRDGESVLFDDTWPHEIKNDSSEIRVVLIVDILRPMAGAANVVNRAMIFLMSCTYGFVVARKARGFSQCIAANRRERYARTGSEPSAAGKLRHQSLRTG